MYTEIKISLPWSSPCATKRPMKSPKFFNKDHPIQNAKTITEAREARDADPDLFYRKNNRAIGTGASSHPHCFIQLFQEPTKAEFLPTMAVKTSTAAREPGEQERALTTRASKTKTRAREEIHQDQGCETYFAIPKC